MAEDEFQELPIKPIYWQEKPNDPIELGQRIVSIPIEIGNELKVSADATIHFDPDPRLEFKTQVGQVDFYKLVRDDPKCRIRLPQFQSEMDVFLGTRDGYARLHPATSVVQLHQSAANVRTVVFHLFNWPDIAGAESFKLKPVDSHRSFSRINRVILTAVGWKVVIQGLENTSDIVKGLEHHNGYQITHTGTIEREDGSLFDTGTVETFLTRLGRFFEFLLGKSSDPSLAVGFDRERNRVFEQFGLANVDGGKWRRDSWFQERMAGDIQPAFSGFMTLCDRTSWWEKQLTYAIYWYRHANMVQKGIGTDSALIFSQAALEMLAHYVCREDSNLLPPDRRKSKQTFDACNAAGKMRTLAEGLGIPVQIPLELTSLRSFPAGWDDSLQAIACLRNDLTHPKVKYDASVDVYYDAWRLSLWYLDLVLLKLCGYNGKYRSRITDKNETVPWG